MGNEIQHGLPLLLSGDGGLHLLGPVSLSAYFIYSSHVCGALLCGVLLPFRYIRLSGGLEYIVSKVFLSR